MQSVLIDLETGVLSRSNAVKAGGDPIEAETWSEQPTLDVLLHDLLFKRITGEY